MIKFMTAIQTLGRKEGGGGTKGQGIAVEISRALTKILPR